MQKNIFSMFLAFVLLVGIVFPSSTSAITIISSDNTPATMDPNLLEEMKHNIGLIEVIVSFYGNEAPTSENIELLKNLGIDSGIIMQALPIAGVLATSSQIEALSKESSVRSLYLNSKVHLYNADSKEITGVTKARTDEAMRKANGGLPVSGKGIGILINDSGIDGTHPDLKFGNNLVQNTMAHTNLKNQNELLPISYIEGVHHTDAASNHGTHVAGTVGGTGAASGGKYAGVAPGADLIGYGSGVDLLFLDSLGGFDYALVNQKKYNIRIINNSWGPLGGDFDHNHPVNIASKICYDSGIVVVFSAGNEGPGEGTHNNFGKVPWVISVAAGTKDGNLVYWSSRGMKGSGGTFTTSDGKSWTWKDEPTITAPGVGIISAKTTTPFTAYAVEDDLNGIEPAYIPYYSYMSGTSMAAPHITGIIALMLEANPSLTPDEVKELLQQTSTNIPGQESWEAGAGYVNAFEAINYAFNPALKYGEILNENIFFNTNVDYGIVSEDITINFNPIVTSGNIMPFKVEDGATELTVKVVAKGSEDLGEGNSIKLILTDPNGTEYSEYMGVYFILNHEIVIKIDYPTPGGWTLRLEDSTGVAKPETIKGNINQVFPVKYKGIEDVVGHPAEQKIKMAVGYQLINSNNHGMYRPSEVLTRNALADFLVMGAGIRQVAQTTDYPAIEAVTSRGAALKGKHNYQGVMLLDSAGNFNGERAVTREDLAYSLIQSLGLQKEAENFSGDVTVDYKGERIVIEDNISADLKGYVQLAIDLGIMNVYYNTTQGPYDFAPTIHANFKAGEEVTRGDYAVAVTRFFEVY